MNGFFYSAERGKSPKERYIISTPVHNPLSRRSQVIPSLWKPNYAPVNLSRISGLGHGVMLSSTLTRRQRSEECPLLGLGNTPGHSTKWSSLSSKAVLLSLSNSLSLTILPPPNFPILKSQTTRIDLNFCHKED